MYVRLPWATILRKKSESSCIIVVLVPLKSFGTLNFFLPAPLCLFVLLLPSSGGLDDVNCYRAVERYDPQSDEWNEVTSLKSPRGGVGVVALGRYLYAAGGNDGSASLQTVEKYDPHVNKWSESAPMSKRRAGVCLAALNGYLYAGGGFDDASPLDTVER